ncbi:MULTISPECIES: UdgX family uracil-DNA binding protein [unclassified Saccharibacter]|uniref:UdgX family uracil-DNA binding protein n=1 Tax=unclassified Saccharibacter TaxID=2648722 RepID=UPI001326FDBC|nr:MULTISPECIES: UdgX family uracil-DNA binding protein [unclassified Saccharibacter]MXV35467.1 UdgX family uracil-DNA binding protein [Saccharibacter sp. EH611]MXV58127.1 UdgX family uracil-DNA binding protein [Saccharibacter sp. EH70]MXV65401.1 UdgX family uracil-DNA binding protein [Saccharibacter sp. EH60]
MKHAKLITESDFIGWRAWARSLLHQYIASENIYWDDRPTGAEKAPTLTRELPKAPSPLRLPRPVRDLIPAVIASGHPERFSLLYKLLEQLRDGCPSFPDTTLWKDLVALAYATRRAAMSLRQILPPSCEDNIKICRIHVPPSLLDSQATALVSLRAAPWLIHTEGRLLLYENGQLFFSTAAIEAECLADDEQLLDHARSTAQPVYESAYWKAIFPLAISPTPAFIEKTPSLETLRAYSVDCALCPLCQPALRTVFGEGNPDAKILFVGEQPGDQEDRRGRPFVGPAGQLFDRALQEAGGERARYWISNAVKHFNFIQRGERRIHQKPEAQHIQACSPWITAERRLLHHRVTVMLGVTGASALLGRPVKITRERSRLFTLSDGTTGLVTVHPSSLLRQPDEQKRQEDYIKFVNDLRLALSAL